MRMNTLEDVPFQTLLGPLEEEMQLVTAPDISIPDCHRILRDTEVTHPSEHSHFFYLIIMFFRYEFISSDLFDSVAFRFFSAVEEVLGCLTSITVVIRQCKNPEFNILLE